MFHKHFKLSLLCTMFFIFLVFAACSVPGSSSSSGNTNTTGGTTSGGTVAAQHGTPGQRATTTTTHVTPISGNGKSNGPIVITSPTLVPGGGPHSQQIKLQDRIIIISNVSKQNGTGANAVAISLTMTVKNTGRAAINNQSSYFQLISSEGDVFGQQSSATPTFFGAITIGASHSGTIVFQIPSAAASNLRLFYRSEIATETVFVSLNI